MSQEDPLHEPIRAPIRAPIRLTQFAKRAGCAAKQPPGYLLPLLATLPPITDPNVLVGTSPAADAAIYRLSDDLALVLTMGSSG